MPTGVVKKLPHEDGYPHYVDPYELAEDTSLQFKWLEESKVLNGPFVPGGTDARLSGAVGWGDCSDRPEAFRARRP